MKMVRVSGDHLHVFSEDGSVSPYGRKRAIIPERKTRGVNAMKLTPPAPKGSHSVQVSEGRFEPETREFNDQTSNHLLEGYRWKKHIDMTTETNPKTFGE
jgi:hypothetical protein